MKGKITILPFLIIFVLVTGAVSPAFAIHEHDATSITDGLIVNADINAAAAIAASKLVGTDIATVGTITTGTWQGTTIAVDQGGTGATTLTDGGILLGSGTGAVTPTAVLGDGEILIGDGTTDPVALDVGSSTAITVLGTITTGTWQGTTIAVDQGGTGTTTSTGSGSVVRGTNPTLTAATLAGDIDADGFDIDDAGVIFLREQAEADADIAGQGQIWVDTQTPNKLFFTDDAGTDFQIGGAGGALNNVVEDTTPQLGGNLDAQNNLIENIGNAGTDFIAGGGLTTAAGITATTGGVTATAGGLTATAGALTITDSDGVNALTSDDATTNNVVDILRLTHSTTGTAGQNLGAGLTVHLENDAGTIEEHGSFDWFTTDPADGSEDTALAIGLMRGGSLAEAARITSTGELSARGGLVGETDDGVTNAVTDVLTATHSTTGTAANNIGTGISIQNENDAGTIEEHASLDFVAVDAADGSEDTNLNINLMAGGTVAQAASLTSVGALTTAAGITTSGDIDTNGNNLIDAGVIFLREQAEADADIAGQGQIWVDTQTPNKLFFTDDAGTDFQIGGAGGALNNVVEDTTPQLGGNLDAQNNLIENIGNAGTDFIAGGGLTTAAGITATTGGVTATAGGLTATAGALTITDSDGTNTVTSDDATAAVTDILTLTHSIAAGAGTSGIGTGISFNVEDAGDIEQQGSVDVTVSTVTNNAEDAEFRWSLNSAGTITERMVLDDTGALTTDAGITATTGGLTATAGGVTITAGDLAMGSGIISDSDGAVTVDDAQGLTVSQGGLTVTAGGATITSGNLDMTDGQILNIGNAGTDFDAGGGLTTAAGITATTGGVTATAGGLTATAGALTITDSDGTNTVTSDDATATVTDILTLTHSIAAGAGTSGIGTGISFNVEDADNIEQQGSVDVTVSTVTGNGEDAEFRWSLNSAGTITERMVLDDTGALTTDAGITATTGGLTATAGGVTITAGDLAMGSGIISDSDGAVTVDDAQGLTVSQGGLTVTAGGATITSGNLDMTDGQILNIGNAGTDFDAGGGLTTAAGITATTGGVTATAGGLTATAGALTITDSDGTNTVTSDDATATVTDILTLTHSIAAGAGTSGIGTGISFNVEDADNIEQQGSVDVTVSTVTGNGEDAEFRWSLNSAGTITERMVLDDSGVLQVDGGLTVSAGAVTLPAGVIATADLADDAVTSAKLGGANAAAGAAAIAVDSASSTAATAVSGSYSPAVSSRVLVFATADVTEVGSDSADLIITITEDGTNCAVEGAAAFTQPIANTVRDTITATAMFTGCDDATTTFTSTLSASGTFGDTVNRHNLMVVYIPE